MISIDLNEEELAIVIENGIDENLSPKDIVENILIYESKNRISQSSDFSFGDKEEDRLFDVWINEHDVGHLADAKRTMTPPEDKEETPEIEDKQEAEPEDKSSSDSSDEDLGCANCNRKGITTKITQGQERCSACGEEFAWQ